MTPQQLLMARRDERARAKKAKAKAKPVADEYLVVAKAGGANLANAHWPFGSHFPRHLLSDAAIDDMVRLGVLRESRVPGRKVRPEVFRADEPAPALPSLALTESMGGHPALALYRVCKPLLDAGAPEQVIQAAIDRAPSMVSDLLGRAIYSTAQTPFPGRRIPRRLSAMLEIGRRLAGDATVGAA
jgi:hypothetical protein